MAEDANRSIGTEQLEELADRIDALARSSDPGMPPVVVDALAEAWRYGLGSAAARKALVLVGRRGTTIVCCPLGRLNPTAPILPCETGVGMTSVEVLRMLGEPDLIEADRMDGNWLHALPSPARDGEPDETPYEVRQAVFERLGASPDDPPFAPLAAGERMFRITTFRQGVVAAVCVGVRRASGRSRSR